VLITLDTTRADALGCYQNPLHPSPVLDAFAQQSVQYLQARASAPITLPSHLSMLTGLYPPRHGVRDNGIGALPDAGVTLAELAQAEGISTAGVTSAVVLHAQYGTAQGFDVFRDQAVNTKQQGIQVAYQPAEKTTATAQAWLKQHSDGQPYFLWVHYFDPHEPYQNRPTFAAKVKGDPYLAEVAAMDASIGQLLSTLRKRSDFSKTTMMVVGDHGEDFGQHGEPTHSVTCYDSTLKVPFLLRYPDGFGANTKSNAIVSVADVFPTGLAALGIASPNDIDGVSLWKQDPPAERGVYFESLVGFLDYGWSPLLGWADASGKYIHSASPEFYKTSVDPQERNNLLSSMATPLSYQSALYKLLRAPKLPRKAVVADNLEAIRALGYAAVADAEQELPDLMERSLRPSPHQSMPELKRFYKAVQQGNAGNTADAIQALQQLVEVNPKNAYALDLLGLYLHKAGEHRQAIRHLQQLLQLGHARGTTHNILGRSYRSLGQGEKAQAHFQEAVRLQPGNAAFLADSKRF
jgi:arylsulfatase A-like enzyme